MFALTKVQSRGARGSSRVAPAIPRRARSYAPIFPDHVAFVAPAKGSPGDVAPEGGADGADLAAAPAPDLVAAMPPAKPKGGAG